MKSIFFSFFITLTGILFALGQTDNRSQNPLVAEQALTITGGFEEVDISLYDPGLLAFIKQVGEDNEEDSPDMEIIRVFRQIVQGYRYINCVKLANGDLAIFIVYEDISGEFSLLESYKGPEIFQFFASFFAYKV